MAEGPTPLKDIKAEAEKTFDQVRDQVESMVDELDIKNIGARVQEFGSRNPIGLALAALTIGVAAGVLMRRRFEE